MTPDLKSYLVDGGPVTAVVRLFRARRFLTRMNTTQILTTIVLMILTIAWLRMLVVRFTRKYDDFDVYMSAGFRTYLAGIALAGVWAAFVYGMWTK